MAGFGFVNRARLRTTKGDPAARSWSGEHGRLGGALLSAPMLCLVGVLLVYPLIKLGSTALGPPNGLGNIGAFFESSAKVRALRITFLDSAIVTLLCVLFGSVVAWSLLTTRSLLMRTLLWSAMVVPFLMGAVIKLYAFTVLLQTNGVINRALQGIGIIDEPLDLLYNQPAVILGMTYQMLPYAVVPLLVGFRTIDLTLVDAAESLGASRIRALQSVVLPLALPNILASGTLVYVISVGFFLTPVLLGGATAPFTAALISQDIFQFYDVTSAAVSALLLLVGSLVVITLVYAIVGKRRLAKAVVV